MTTRLPVVATKVGIVVLLAAAAVIGPRETAQSLLWLPLFVFAIGAFNVLVSVPGTYGIRTAAVAASFAGLLVPGARGAIILLFWLIWPPAFLVAWALAGSSVDEDGYIQRTEHESAFSPARVKGAALTAAVAVAALAYKLIFHQQLQQTAALFVGVPALLAIVVVLFVSPRSATGVACKAATVGLLISLLFLGEGMLCVVMSAPIFYGVAVAVAAGMSAARRRRIDDPTRTMYSSLVLLAVLVSSLEGVSSSLSFDRRESVTAERIVTAPASDIQRAVLEPPRFERVMPVQLLAGFPRPMSVHLDGAGQWTVRMRGGEMRLDGMEPRAGDLILRLEESRPGLVRWSALSDNSHMTHFLTWRAATVEWQAIDPQTTKVTWTLQYDRGLDPAWYFGPWERYVAGIAAGYLIDAVATP